ncbi:MAG: alpha/beta hydrolase [Cyanobacteria bacterium P01_E01_bin.34]
MYVITNRNLQKRKSDTQRFGISFNEEGPGILRLAEAQKENGKWKVDVLDDLVVYEGEEMFASEEAFLKTQARMCEQSRNCLIFCHGFNTSFKGALDAAYQIEQAYDLEVALFTWPSDGKVTNYLSDKQQALESLLAFDRFFEKLRGYFLKYRDRNCGQKFSLAMHSMGNFMFENLIESRAYQGETHFLDNIILLSADVNNPGHETWIDLVKCRNRLFVTINEEDFALNLSDSKSGEEQKARLGNTIRNLSSSNAFYVDFTDAAHVENQHNYFSSKAALKNARIKQFFQVAFDGGRAERGLEFNGGAGAYIVT